MVRNQNRANTFSGCSCPWTGVLVS